MRKIIQSLFFISIVTVLVAVAYFLFLSRADFAVDEPVRLRSLEAGSDNKAADASKEANSDIRATSAIPLEQNETLLDLYSYNLDFDDEDEQVLVIRDSNDTSGKMRILVADYSPYTKRWSRSWSGSTLVTKVKTFQANVSDLIGDHNLNIVCTGMNDSNDQTMTIFWKSPEGGQSQGPSFVKVFEQAGNAVVIEVSDRPESYKLGQSNADSLPISVWRVDSASGNYMDQLKESWQWSFAAKTYAIVATERIPGANIAQKMAESILDGNEATFKAFLDGTWYKESNDPLSPNALFITFQSRDSSVMFSGEGLIEVFEWENSNPTRYGLYIASRNQSVRNLRRLMDIELASTDSVNVRVFQDYRIKADIAGTWDGRYRRLGVEMAKSFKRSPAMAEITAIDLAGEYRGADGSTLLFKDSFVTFNTGDKTETGTWAVYSLDGRSILDMRMAHDSMGAGSRRSYILVLNRRKERSGELVRTLSLTEARIGIHGIEMTQAPMLVFESR
jgi:hypothetical protein